MIRAMAAWAADMRAALNSGVVDPRLLAQRIADPLCLGPMAERDPQDSSRGRAYARLPSAASSPSR